MKKLIISLITVFLTILSFSQMTHQPMRDSIAFSPQWNDNLIFLNNMGDEALPMKQQVLYKWAELFLAGNTEASFAELSEDWHFKNYCEKHNIFHLGGPLLGNITNTSVSVWMRTTKPASVKVLVNINGAEVPFGPVSTSLESDLSAVVNVHGLQPNTTYTYKVFIDDVEIPLPEGARIQTPTDDKKELTRIVFGSCYHRWGLGNMQQTKTILERNPNAFLGLGDIAVQDKNNNIGYHTLDFMARDLYPAWQKMVASVPFFALWDDHDYFDDDKSGIPAGYTNEDREKVWRSFRYAWNNPSYGFGEEGKGVFFRTRVGHCDIIMIDHRYFRTKESFLGDEQMVWLEEQLLDCEGPFIILAGGTMWSDYVSAGKDSWGVFDKPSREKIFSLIEKHNIPGVLLISGDRHGSRGFAIPRESGFKLYEFEVASLGGLGGQPATKPEWTTQTYGLNGGFAFGEFTINAKPKDPTVSFRLIGDDGGIIHEMTLTRSQLTPHTYK